MDGERPDDEDNALMAAWVAGDSHAFDLLYGRCKGPLYRYLMHHLRHRAQADELFQDVWQRVIAARTQWRPSGSFRGWLFQIAHHRLNDHWRAQTHRPAAPVDAEERVERLAEDWTPERNQSEFEQRRALQRAIEHLPEEQRHVVLLRLDQELTLEEIARITGVGRETVKSRLRYAMDRLRAEVLA